MGLYLQTPESTNKAQQIVDLLGGEIVPQPYEFERFRGTTLMCVVVNPQFDAALVVNDPIQWERCVGDVSGRPRVWLRVSTQMLVLELLEQGITEGKLRAEQLIGENA